MGNVIDITKTPRRKPGKIDEYLLGDVAENVRQFLRTTWLGTDSHADPWGLEAGRALIEDFALRAAALADNKDQEEAEHGQDLTLAEVALVLRYVHMVEVKEGVSCYGHSGGRSACGKDDILEWLVRNVERYAEKLGEVEAADDGDDAA